MPRTNCPHCQRLLSQCLCDHVKPYLNKHQLIILQHPSEQGHAKGTAGLIQLALQNCQLMVGESENDFSLLQAQIKDAPLEFAVLYPNPNSQALSEQKGGNIKRLILIDGTWRKAYKIWQLNPWLHALPSLHFSPAPTGRYQIRKSPKEDGLSSLEAAAYALQQLENASPEPLLHLLDIMVEQQFSHMSKQVKQRYQK